MSSSSLHARRSVFRPSARARRCLGALALLAAALVPATAHAEVPVQRTFFRLSSSNGFGAVMLDLAQAKLTHFREHPFATEEPLLDAQGKEVWNGNQPQAVKTRDLLYDAYFGLRANGDQAWLTKAPVDLDASGWAAWKNGAAAGTGVATMVQKVGDLELTQYFFAPEALGHAGFVMAMRVRNTGAAVATGVSAFSLHNFHLGFGRPGAMSDIGENGETVTFDGAGGKADLLERAFAGVVVARPLTPVAHHDGFSSASPPAQNAFAIVDGGGTTDLPDLNGQAPTADGSVTAYQWDLGDIAPGGEKWVGVAFAHHGDPFAGATAQGWLDAYVGASDAKALVDAEIAKWAALQQSLTLPPGLDPGDEALARQSAVMMKMAQVQESQSYLREFLSQDGEPRYTRFGASLGDPPAQLPATITHRGKGAVLASLPPGEWTVAWIRDGAYATSAMAALGMKNEAHDALAYYLGAEAGRFQSWNELKPYGMPPYQVSLVRYHGFGVEETDFNDFGPNLEFDGFGLFLWALRNYERRTMDTSLADSAWPVVTSKVADVLVALVDPATGLLRKDSSIWETHWNGRERAWTYTNITAARGLCDAAAIATRMGDTEHAKTYQAAGEALRAAIATHLTDANRALASNAEELASGDGYWDAAVLDGIAMGLFDPKGAIAKATLAGLDAHLAAPAGAGWARNDDRFDHSGKDDLSPWGSEYDSAEWVVTDLRGAAATHLAGDEARSDRLVKWVRDQSLANYLAISETYDEGTGTYKFNAPMIGFGAGAWELALFARNEPADPACGAYFDESSMGTGAGGGSASGGGGDASGAAVSGAGGSGGGGSDEGDAGGCGCRFGGAPAAGGWAALGALALAAARRRRRR